MASSALHHLLPSIEDSGCQTLALSSCFNLLTSTRSLALSTHSPPVHVPSHCFPPVLIQISPVLGRFLPPCSFDRNRRFSYPLFVRNMSTRPCLCIKQLMHKSSPDCVSFQFNHPKLLEITVECLHVHGSTCAPYEDDQFDCPSRALSFCILCNCFKPFDQDIMLSSCFVQK